MNPRKLGTPDLIILPGTKNTISDMIFLKESGLAARLINLRAKGVPFIGICGGYQMLGRKIMDPHGIEGTTKSVAGLGFLDCETVISEEKELAQVSGQVVHLPFAEQGTEFQGYEIHMGNTLGSEGEEQMVGKRLSVSGEQEKGDQGNNQINQSDAPLIITSRRNNVCSEKCGSLSEDGEIFGCYIHGFFDQKELRNQLIKWLTDKKDGNAFSLKLDLPLHSNLDNDDLNDKYIDQFDRLADMLEKHVNLKKISLASYINY